MNELPKHKPDIEDVRINATYGTPRLFRRDIKRGAWLVTESEYNTLVPANMA